MVDKVFDPTKCDWHDEKIDDIEKVVWGNSSGGLVRDLASIKTYVKVILAVLVPTLFSVIGILVRMMNSGG